jgi:hypothetical protein
MPHMQGSFSASVDEVTWVVTTYLVAAGIMTPAIGYKTKPRPSLPAIERGHKPHADCSTQGPSKSKRSTRRVGCTGGP